MVLFLLTGVSWFGRVELILYSKFQSRFSVVGYVEVRSGAVRHGQVGYSKVK